MRCRRHAAGSAVSSFAMSENFSRRDRSGGTAGGGPSAVRGKSFEHKAEGQQVCFFGKLVFDHRPGVRALDQPPPRAGAVDHEAIPGSVVENLDADGFALPHVQPGGSGLRAGDPGHGILVGTGGAQRYPIYNVSCAIRTGANSLDFGLWTLGTVDFGLWTVHFARAKTSVRTTVQSPVQSPQSKVQRPVPRRYALFLPPCQQRDAAQPRLAESGASRRKEG